MGVVEKLARELWDATHPRDQQERGGTNNEHKTHGNKQLATHVEQNNATRDNEQL